MIYFTSKTIQVSVARVYSVLWRPILASLMMCLADKLVLEGSTVTPVLALFLHIALGLLTYSVALALLWQLSRKRSGGGAEQLAFGYLRKAFIERMEK
jgi:hypothetical protein